MSKELRVLLVLCSFFFIVLPVASELRVFDGEYIIQTKPVRASGFQALGVSRAQNLGADLVLVRDARRYAALTSGKTKSVPFDPSNNLCTELRKAGQVLSCSPNYEIRIDAQPNDPDLRKTYGIESTEAPKAWDLSTGTDRIVIGVIDSGVDYSHPDLASNMWTNPAEIAGNGVDDDLNGFVDDIHGYDFYDNDGDPMDSHGHGTHVSGTIAARGDNGLGVAGINWRAQIIALRFLGSDGSGSLADAIRALNYVTLMKQRGVNIRVTNNSWGGGAFSEALQAAIRGLNDAQVIFVAAAGNESNDNDQSPTYPSGYDLPNVISVAAVDQNYNLATFSNYGARAVHIAAPGVSIYSTFPGGRYATMSGTSMAAPHVAGALALLFSYREDLTIEGAKSQLLSSATQKDQLKGVVSGRRFLNVFQALISDQNNMPAPPPPISCTYSVQEAARSIDRSADQAELIMQADEGYIRVSLPFAMPFFDNSTRFVSLSPNGVVYFGDAPADIDFQPIQARNAFEALHTDLSSLRDPYGIRVSKSKEKVVISWYAKVYQAEALGDVRIRVALYPNGEIYSWLDIDSELLPKVQSAALIGISGISTEGRVTFAAPGGTVIQSNTALRFTPECSGSSAPEINRIEFKGVAVRGVSGGERVSLIAEGSGSGMFSLSAAIDGMQCSQSKAIAMVNGSLSANMIVPRRIMRGLTLSLGGISKKLRVKAGQLSARSSRSTASKACANLFSSLR